MKRFLITSVLMLAFAAVYGLAQTATATGQTSTTTSGTTTTTPPSTATTPSTTTTQPQTTPPTTGAPAPATTAPMSPAAPSVQPAPGATSQQPPQQGGPGVPASAIPENPGTSPGVPASSLGDNTSPADLQNKIMTSLQGNSTLVGTGLSVTVGADQIQVSGSVQNSQQKEAAMRIVQSFARNRKVVDNVTVINPTSPTTSTPPPPSITSTMGTQQQNANRPSTGPQTQGDESASPK